MELVQLMLANGAKEWYNNITIAYESGHREIEELMRSLIHYYG